MLLDYDGNQNVSAVCGVNLSQAYVDASSTCGGRPLAVSYGYDSAGIMLTRVTDVLGHVVTLSYLGANYVYKAGPTCISLPDSATCELQNAYGSAPGDPNPQTAPDQVRLQTTALGAVWQYAYIPQPDPNDEPVVIGKPRWSYAFMFDPEGNETDLTYDRGRLVENWGPAGYFNLKYAERYIGTTPVFASGQPYQFEYHDITPTLLTKPEHDREYFEHDLRGNITLHSTWPKNAPDPPLPNGNPAIPTDSDLNGCCISPQRPVFPAGSITVSQTFMPDAGYQGYYTPYVVGCGSGGADARLCNKPITQIDGNGRQTDFTYAQAHGGVLTETGPADVNNVRPQTRYAYVQRTAWILANGGGWVAQSPVWLLASKSLCRTGAAASSGTGCAIAGDEVVTSYEYGPDSGPNNLLLRGVVEDATGPHPLRTCYGYNAQGDRISETRPRGTSAGTACP